VAVPALIIAALILTGCSSSPPPPRITGHDLYTPDAVARAHAWLIDHPSCPHAHCGVVLRVSTNGDGDWKAVVFTNDQPDTTVLAAHDCYDNGDIALAVDAGDALAWTGKDTTICRGEWQVITKGAVT